MKALAATLSHHDGFYYGEHTGEFIEIQALRIHITYAGEGDPVLLIHGAGQNSYTWRHQFEALAERYFVVAVDMIGYGYSDKPDLTYTIEENSEFLLALLNTLRFQQPVLLTKGLRLLFHILFNPLHCGMELCLACRIVRGGKQNSVVQNAHRAARQRIDFADPFNLVSKKFDAYGPLAMAGRKNLQYIAPGSERATHEIDVVSLILDIYQMANDIISIPLHTGAKRYGQI